MSHRLNTGRGLLRWGSVLVAALPLAAGCASSGTQEVAQPTAGGWTPVGVAEYAAVANNEDIQEAQLAVVKAADPAVRDFARRILTDDDAVSRSAAALLTRLGVTPPTLVPSAQSAAPDEDAVGAVAVPPQPNDAGVAEVQAATARSLARLNSLSGGAFDASYIAHQIREHQALLFALDETLIPNAHDHDVARFLKDMRLVVQEHLARAQDLNKARGG